MRRDSCRRNCSRIKIENSITDHLTIIKMSEAGESGEGGVKSCATYDSERATSSVASLFVFALFFTFMALTIKNVIIRIFIQDSKFDYIFKNNYFPFFFSRFSSKRNKIVKNAS